MDFSATGTGTARGHGNIKNGLNMESLLQYVYENIHYAHYVIFSLIVLTAFSIPISEKLILLTAGAIAGHSDPEMVSVLKIFMWTLLACWVAGSITYWLGRLLGPRLLHFPWLSRILSSEHLETLNRFLKRFGFFTFVIGRLMPGSFRNALFISSGLTKMPFHLFIMRDGIGCLLITTLYFSLGFLFGESYL